jgi:hypothetical protein
VKKLFVLLALGFAVFVWVYRERLFLRDPLGVVERDGVKEDGARVFINYSNDVLMRDGGQWVLVQGWSRVAGLPARLNCVQGLACMTEADHAEVTSAGTKVEMSNRVVTFVDDDGVAVRVALR